MNHEKVDLTCIPSKFSKFSFVKQCCCQSLLDFKEEETSSSMPFMEFRTSIKAISGSADYLAALLCVDFYSRFDDGRNSVQTPRIMQV